LRSPPLDDSTARPTTDKFLDVFAESCSLLAASVPLVVLLAVTHLAYARRSAIRACVSTPTMLIAMSTMLIGMVVGVRRASATNLRPPTAFVVDKDGAVPVPPSEEELRERRKWVRRADGLGAGLTLVAVVIAFVTYEREPKGGLQTFTRVSFEAVVPLFVGFFLEAVTMAGEWCVAGKVLNFAFFQLLGEWSYAIYVLQFPVCE